MQQVFGLPEPTLLEAIQRNPGAMAEHALWNIRLLPDGLQVLLFGATSGNLDPDYGPVQMDKPYAGVLGLLLIATLIVGGVLLYRQRNFWWRQWFRDRLWGWLLMLSLVVTVGVVILMQRPRPEYLYNLSIFIMAATGMALYAISHHWPVLKQLSAAVPIVMVALVVLVPGYYDPIPGTVFRPDYRIYQRLTPFAALFSQPVNYVGPGNAQVMCNYVATALWSHCQGFAYIPTVGITGLEADSLAHGYYPQIQETASLAEVLDKHQVTLFYADEDMYNDPKVREFFLKSASLGWDTIAAYNSSQDNWFLLKKR